MIRRFLLLIMILLACYALWWIGPLIAIGTFFPLASSGVRQILIAMLLCYALWPLTARLVSPLFRYARAPLPGPEKKKVPQDRITTRFYDALRTLQQANLSRQKTRWQRWRQRWSKNYLREKPWFLIMGPPGCGKTAMIYQNGEGFLLPEHYGLGQTTETGPTRDCNWWLTERAVYIDTSGEWLQLQDQSEAVSHARQTLFSLIRQYRRFPAIDGMILCLNAAELFSASLSERKTLADTLRVRLLEAASLFRCDIAVYLLLNQLDRLPGGEAFLTVLSDVLLAEGLGIALPVTPQGESALDCAEASFTALQTRISRYILEVLPHAPDSPLRHQLLLFTETLGTLRNSLLALLPQVFPRLPAGYAARLRQLWLGSITTRPAGGIYSPALTRAIDERGILLTSGPLPLPQRLLTAGRQVVVTLILFSLLLFMAVRYFQEANAIVWTAARFAETKRRAEEALPSAPHHNDLLSASEQLGYLSTPFVDRVAPLPFPYAEQHLLSKALQQTWQRHLYKIFWPAVERFVVQELHKNILSSDAEVYDSLKIYMMLLHPRYRDPALLESWFMPRWRDFAPASSTEQDRQRFRAYLHALFSDRSAAAPVASPDAALLRRAQLSAMKIPLWLRVIHEIQHQPLAPHINNVTLADAAGQEAALVLRRKSQSRLTEVAIPAFYTRAGYRDHFLSRLQAVSAAIIREAQWVLNNAAHALSDADVITAAQKLADEAQKQYLIQYADEWERFMQDIRLRQVSGLDDAAQLARQLAEPSSPLATLVRYAATEVTLHDENLANVPGWLAQQSRRLSQVRRGILDDLNGQRARHRTTPEQSITERFTALRRLAGSLENPASPSGDPLTRAFDQVYNSLVTLTLALRAGQILPQNSEFSRLEIDMAGQPEPVRSVIMDLIAIGQAQSLQQSKENLGRGMASLAVGLCKKAVSGRYPFKRSAHEEVGIADFGRLFAPGGAMHHFFERYLAPYVDNRGGRWQVKPGSQGVVGQQTLAAFENAALIRDTFFDASGKLALSMLIRPLALSPAFAEAVLDIDGQQIVYSHGYVPPVHINWPGPKGGVYVQLRLKTRDGRVETLRFDGPWALFRFYDASHPITSGEKRRELTLTVNGTEALFRLELSATMKDYPLWSRALTPFPCPESL
ncbi:type VI secretion system membrane subunit TssM [[Erwinia] mediterraneensis]|uniref:type VI secretion system membrane subunit TssM n=1 Tax=[Erwinia] mediterraneensis TaxID=2161819 RepID=UPI00102F4238|nr:type VI secretion system membrane subunit TssM [[Erwinia] mediterraneensis]